MPTAQKRCFKIADVLLENAGGPDGLVTVELSPGAESFGKRRLRTRDESVNSCLLIPGRVWFDVIALLPVAEQSRRSRRPG